MQLIMRTYQLTCPYGRIDALTDFGMNENDSDTPGACLQNLVHPDGTPWDKFNNQDCSSETYINRQIVDTWFAANCIGQEACIMSFPEQ